MRVMSRSQSAGLDTVDVDCEATSEGSCDHARTMGGCRTGARRAGRRLGQAPSAAQGSQEVYTNAVRYSRGQSVQPVFEGWSRNPDGSFDMWFGYLNRNYEERLNILVGPDNGFNGEDMGQPEFFETRRQQFAFKVNVPATFPKDAIWSGR